VVATLASARLPVNGRLARKTPRPPVVGGAYRGLRFRRDLPGGWAVPERGTSKRRPLVEDTAKHFSLATEPFTGRILDRGAVKGNDLKPGGRRTKGEFVSSSVGKGFVLITVGFPRDLSAAEQEQAAEELLDAADAAAEPVAIVDLSGMDAAYSRFLGALLALRRKQGQRGGRVLVAALRPLVAEALRRCALDMLFEAFPTVESAVRACGANLA